MNRSRRSLAPLLVISLALHAAPVSLALWLRHSGSTTAAPPISAASDPIGVTLNGSPPAKKPVAGAPVGEPRPESGSESGTATATGPSAAADAPAAATAPGAPAVASAPVTAGAPIAAAELDRYATQVRALIERKLRYPLSLQRRGIGGRVEVRLALDGQGGVSSRQLTRPSGHRELDELALEAVSASAPYPVPPGGAQGTGPLQLTLPIEFKIAR